MTRLGWHLLTGVVFGIAATIIAPLLGLTISSNLPNHAGQVTWLELFGGAFLCGVLIWWPLAGRSGRAGAIRGAAAGAITGLLCYPVVIALAELIQRDWGNAPPWSERFQQVELITSLTVITTGLPGVLLMALTGAGMALLNRRFGTGRDVPRAGLTRSPALWGGVIALAVLIVAGLAAIYVWFGLPGVDAPDVTDTETGAEMSYADSLTAFSQIEATEAGLGLNDLCHSILLTHGKKVERAVLYLHGFTSCPAQADALAAQLFAKGFNVYMPRMYGHGLATPSPSQLDDFNADELIDFTSAAVDLVQGLGDEVTVMGLSAGGTLTGWAAQFRPDVDHAVLISPFFGPYVVPTWAMQTGTNVTRRLPNIVFSWNPLETATPEKAAITHAMPTTHALTEIMLVGWVVHEAAQHSPPAAHRISLLLNAADVAVNNRQTDEIVGFWRQHGVESTVSTFPFSHHLPHDMINTRERGANVDLVFPEIFRLLDAE